MYRLATVWLLVLVLGSIWAPPPPSRRTFEVHLPEPQAPVVVVFPPLPGVVRVVAVPAPAVPAVVARDPDDLGPCPAPYTRVSQETPAAPPAGLDDATRVTSPWDVRLVAVWDQEAVMLSTDEGRRWQRVLDHADSVGDVAFDCHGRLHVARGDGLIGTYDEAAAVPEVWVRAATLDDRAHADSDIRLIPDGTGVALIGADVAVRDQLILARRDARGRWRSTTLLDDPAYGSWDGIAVEAIDVRRDGRVHLVAMPWQGGECGYARYIDLTFDLDLRRVTLTQLGEERPDLGDG